MNILIDIFWGFIFGADLNTYIGNTWAVYGQGILYAYAIGAVGVWVAVVAGGYCEPC